MLSDETRLKLFDLAYQYRKTKLWTRLVDLQLFAVALPEGETGYCCVMGMNGEHVALGVYVGQQGFASFCTALNSGPESEEDTGYFASLPALEQDFLECAFDDGEFITPEQMEQARQAARQLHLRPRSPLRYPCFTRYRPMRRPEPLEDEKEGQILALCLRAALFLSSHRVPVAVTGGPGSSLPLLTETAPGEFSVTRAMTPASDEVQVPVPRPLDEITVRRLKNCRADGTWDCAIYALNSFLEEDPSVLPSSPVARNADTGMDIPVYPVMNYEQDPDGLCREFAEQLISLKIRPSGLRVHRSDLRGRAFFGVLADQLGIPLEISSSLPELESTLNDLDTLSTLPDSALDPMDDAVRELCGMIHETPLSQLRMMPEDMRPLLSFLLNAEHPAVTPEVRDKLARLIDLWN